MTFTEEDTENRKLNVPSSEDSPLSEGLTPDEVLNTLGSKNGFLISCVVVTGLTWTAMAMNGLCAAFITQNCKNCTKMESIVDEFNLRDDKAYLSDGTTTVFMIGNMLGGTVVSPAADKYGRRPMLLFCLFVMAISGILAAFSPSVYFFALMRFIQGIFYTGGALIGWVLGYECTPLTMRFSTSVFFGMAWVAGYCLVAPLAFFSPSWRWLIFLVSFPHLLMAIWCYISMPESLHFLVSKRRFDEVEDWLEKARRRNETVPAIDPLMVVSTQNIDQKPSNLFVELWKHKKFLLYTIVLIYLWICDTFIYFGLSLYSTHLAGNVYINYLVMGLVEIPAYLLSPIAMNKFGRRIVVGGTHIMAAVTFFGLMFSPDIRWMTISLWMLGKFTISCSFMGVYVYASEIFPTNIRNLSIGFCEMMSRIGGILAPYVAVLARVSPFLPMLVLSLISAIGGLLTFILPETLNKRLPSTIKESSER